jgi:hypothetical protein
MQDQASMISKWVIDTAILGAAADSLGPTLSQPLDTQNEIWNS